MQPFGLECAQTPDQVRGDKSALESSAIIPVSISPVIPSLIFQIIPDQIFHVISNLIFHVIPD
jgi:hypothetical protein